MFYWVLLHSVCKRRKKLKNNKREIWRHSNKNQTNDTLQQIVSQEPAKTQVSRCNKTIDFGNFFIGLSLLGNKMIYIFSKVSQNSFLICFCCDLHHHEELCVFFFWGRTKPIPLNYLLSIATNTMALPR